MRTTRKATRATSAVVEALEQRKLFSASTWVAMGGLAYGPWLQLHGPSVAGLEAGPWVTPDETRNWVVGPTGVPPGESVSAVAHGPSNPHLPTADGASAQDGATLMDERYTPDLPAPPSPAMARIGDLLARLSDEYRAFLLDGGQPAAFQSANGFSEVVNGSINIAAYPNGIATSELLAMLETFGLQNGTIGDYWVEGNLPLASVADVATEPRLLWLREQILDFEPKAIDLETGGYIRRGDPNLKPTTGTVILYHDTGTASSFESSMAAGR